MTFREFDSFEQMAEFMQQATQAANERSTPAQKAIGYGDFWGRVYDDIVIIGYVWTVEESQASSRRHGATAAEVRYETARMVESHADGYRFGKAWSILEPDGELGSTHVSEMTPIPRDHFYRLAERFGFDVTKLV